MLQGEGGSTQDALSFDFPITTVHALSTLGINQVQHTPVMNIADWATSQTTTFIHVGVQSEVKFSSPMPQPDKTVESELGEEEDWVVEDTTPSEQDKDWVLASWSGPDTELEEEELTKM